MNKVWETDLDSDVGTLQLRIEYSVDHGELGDYNSPSIQPSIIIEDMQISIKKLDTTVVDHMRDEILEQEISYDPEDYRD